MMQDLLEWQRLSGDQIQKDLLNSKQYAPESNNLHIFEETFMNPNLQFDILKHLIKDFTLL